jgi:N-acetylglucosamine-6-phosphate deacetylase
VLDGRILTPDGWIAGSIRFGERIDSINEDSAAAGGPWILPGFIDLHVHGAGGVDIMQGGGAGATVARHHARHGTTAMLGTTMTAREAAIRQALQGLAGPIAQRPPAARACWACTWKAPSSTRRAWAPSRPTS